MTHPTHIHWSVCTVLYERGSGAVVRCDTYGADPNGPRPRRLVDLLQAGWEPLGAATLPDPRSRMGDGAQLESLTLRRPVGSSIARGEVREVGRVIGSLTLADTDPPPDVDAVDRAQLAAFDRRRRGGGG